MERARSNAGFGDQFRAYCRRSLRASPSIAPELAGIGDLFLAHRSRALFAGAVRALAFRVGLPFVSASALPGHRARSHRNGSSDAREIPNLRGAGGSVELHASAW